MLTPKPIKIALHQSQKSGRRKPHGAMSAEVSPDSKCPICLDVFNNISYLDLCLHKFCFCCIHEWSKNKAECPLCKQPFNSIYHSIKSEQDFKKYDLRPIDNDSFGTFGGVAASEGRAVRSLREQEMINFRRELYRRGVRVRSVRDGGRSRDTSAEFFRRNPACLHRLIPWLKRELTDGAIQEELRPFLRGRTEQFLHEFISFAKAPFHMEAYDQHAVYDCPAPSSNEYSSPNSSVIAISEDEEHPVELDPPGESASSLSHSMWDDETPGPSYSTTEVSPLHQANVIEGEVNQEECLSSDNEDCVIVGFVKPTAERTPEVVKLSSDSDESTSEDSKEMPPLSQHIRFSSLSPVASRSSDPSSAGRSSSTSHHRQKRHSKSDRKDTGRIYSNDRSREQDRSKDRDCRRRRGSRSRERSCSSKSPTVCRSTVSSLSRNRSCRDIYSQCASYKSRDGDDGYQSYRRFSQERNYNGTYYTERQSYYYSSRKCSDQHSYSHSRSSSRESQGRGKRHSRSRHYSSSQSPSTKKRSHQDKRSGKRKYKARHLEGSSENVSLNSHAHGDSPSITKHKKKSKEKHHKNSKDRSWKLSRSLSIELVNEENPNGRSKHHHKKKKKHKKKSKRHKSSERKERGSPTVITIDSESDSVTQANSTHKDTTIADDPV
uniref:E3 ubiquitin-protein ligase Topors n=1 Tax=Mola mola TaxID=94237 RepID=A0A3Q3WHB5_MOLML